VESAYEQMARAGPPHLQVPGRRRRGLPLSDTTCPPASGNSPSMKTDRRRQGDGQSLFHFGVAGVVGRLRHALGALRGERQTAPRLEADRVIAADGATLPLKCLAAATDATCCCPCPAWLQRLQAGLRRGGPFLAARDITTYAYDQRSFGVTAQRGIWPGSELLMDDARTVAALLRRRTQVFRFTCLGKAWEARCPCVSSPKHPKRPTGRCWWPRRCGVGRP